MLQYYRQYFRAYFRQHSKDLASISAVFLAFFTITNLAYGIFRFRLSEFFTYTLDTFHSFLHFGMNILVFSWLRYVSQWLWFSLTWLGSCVLPIEPYFPPISIPGWVSDLMLFSLALSRMFDSAYSQIPRDVREAAEKDTTPEMFLEIEKTQGSLNWLHKVTHLTTTFIWRSIRLGERVLTTRIGGVALSAAVAEGILRALAAMVFFWGIVRFIGYSINVGMAGHLDHIPLMRMRRKLFIIFWLSFFAALVAFAVFVYANGWLV